MVIGFKNKKIEEKIKKDNISNVLSEK